MSPAGPPGTQAASERITIATGVCEMLMLTIIMLMMLMLTVRCEMLMLVTDNDNANASNDKYH